VRVRVRNTNKKGGPEGAGAVRLVNSSVGFLLSAVGFLISTVGFLISAVGFLISASSVFCPYANTDLRHQTRAARIR
jgi:hypothetical protein